MTVPDIVGIVGVALIGVAYFLIQSGRWKVEEPRYSIVNGLGAALVLFSLYFAFNLAAALVEGFWLVVSIYGLWRSRRVRQD